MATNDDWVPIPPLSELKTLAEIYHKEHEHACKQYSGATVMYTKNTRIGNEAIRQGWDAKQVTALRAKANAVIAKHMEAHEAEKDRLDNLIRRTREDMRDHKHMVELGHPSSVKRARHFHAMCDPFPPEYAKKWVYEHLPSDVRAPRRARALERWRKAAYLVGVLGFWKHVTNKDKDVPAATELCSGNNSQYSHAGAGEV